MQTDANLTITTTLSYFQLSQAAFKARGALHLPGRKHAVITS